MLRSAHYVLVISVLIQMVEGFPAGSLQDGFNEIGGYVTDDSILKSIETLRNLLESHNNDYNSQNQLLRWLFADNERQTMDTESPRKQFDLSAIKRGGNSADLMKYYNTMKNCLRTRLNPSLRDICEKMLHV